MKYEKIVTQRSIPEILIICDSCKHKFILTAVQIIKEDGLYIQKDEVRLMTQISVYYCPYCGAKETAQPKED